MFYLCLFMFVPFGIHAQQPYFINYSVNVGMPSSEAYCVIQDQKGYIWASTDAGITRFDGYRFKTYTTQDGLTDNTVFLLEEDHLGRIWCATLSGRICYYENEKFHHLPANDSLVKILGWTSLIKMDIGEDGILYLCNSDMNIIRIKPPYRAADLMPFSKATPGAIHLVKYAHHSMPLAKDSTNIFTQFILEDRTGKYPILFNGNYGILRSFDKGAHTYFSISNTIYFFDHHVLKDSIHLGAIIIALYEDVKGNLWAGTQENGIYIFKSGKLSKNKPLHIFKRESVSFISGDEENGIWFTSLKNGLFHVPYPGVINYTEMSLLDDNKVYGVTRAGTRVIAGKSNGEITMVDVNTLTAETIQFNSIQLKSNKQRKAGAIIRIYVNGNSVLFQGHHTFICPLDNFQHRNYIFDEEMIKARKFRYVNNKKEEFQEMRKTTHSPVFSKDYGIYDQDYDYLVGARWISFINRKSNAIESYFDFNHSRMNSTLCKDKTIWIGTSNGLWRFKDSLYVYYGDTLPLLKNRIENIQFLNDGRFVIATKAIGLIVWHPSGHQIEQVTTQQGLPSNTCKSIFVENDSMIWVSTNKGLSLVNIKAKKVKFNYTIRHGLPSNEINQTYVDERYIWIATSHGLCCIDRQQSFENKVLPPIYITGMRVNSKPIALGASIPEIDFRPEPVKVLFTGLSYKSLGKCQYKYRLKGLHDRWYYTRTPYVEFSSLNPGDYTFEVYAINSSGLESIQPARLSFVVLAPFWMKTWFVVTVAILLIVLVYLLFRFRLNLVRKREAKTVALNRALMGLKLKALRAQMNPHFTFNVMNSIQHFILEKDEESAHRYLSKFSKLIRIILQHSEEDSIPIAEEIKALELYLELEAMRFDNRFEYSIEVDKTIDVMQTKIPSMLIQPYVENAVKHGITRLKKKGNIRIRIENLGDRLKCTVEDNGVGRGKIATKRDTGIKHRSLGTSITQDRLSVINALNNVELTEKTIDLKDEKGEALGTRVEIYIPREKM